VIKAFVVIRSGQQATSDDLKAFCTSRLASFKRPEFYEFLPELPKNALGKILRKDLRSGAAA
jgi:acyl-CoA synthetase (AMP-forming)/AMP-acid ligase II